MGISGIFLGKERVLVPLVVLLIGSDNGFYNIK
jgi:hypothetical protein